MAELLHHLHLVLALLLPAEDIVVGLPLLKTLEHCLIVHHYPVEFFVPDSFVQGVLVVRTSMEDWIGLHILSLPRCEEVSIQLTFRFFIGGTRTSSWYQLVSVPGEANQSRIGSFGQRHLVGLRRRVFSLKLTLVASERIRLCICHALFLGLPSGSN